MQYDRVRMRTNGRIMAGIVAAVATVWVGGCWSYRAGPPRVAQAPRAGVAWPERDVGPLRPLLEATPGEIHLTRLRAGVDPASVPKSLAATLGTPDVVVRHKGIYGHALLRIFEERTDSARTSAGRDGNGPGGGGGGGGGGGRSRERRRVGPPGSLTFTPNAFMVTSRTLTHPQSVSAFAAQKVALSINDAVSAAVKEPIERVPGTEDLRLDSGLACRIPMNDCSQARGIVLHLQSLASNPFEPEVLGELERRGWVQIDLATQSAVATPIPEKDQKSIDELRRQSDSLVDRILSARTDATAPVGNPENHPRYQDQRALQRQIAKLQAGVFEACPGTDLDALGAQIAREVDDAIAGNAYGAEALLRYVGTRPDLAGKPVAVLAFSAGALAAPAVVARLDESTPGAVRATVLIGGAADLFTMSQRSDLFDGGVRVRCDDKKVDRATLDAIGKSYLAHAALDPYALAPRMAGMPVLQVHASLDTWVPASGGELLYERLGRPDRLTVLGGHQILFYTLPTRSKQIADWVERHALPGAADATGQRPVPQKPE